MYLILPLGILQETLDQVNTAEGTSLLTTEVIPLLEALGVSIVEVAGGIILPAGEDGGGDSSAN